MKTTATIAIRGRVGDHELLPGPWLEGLNDSLQSSTPAIAFRRSDGEIKHARMIAGTATLNEDSTLLHVDVEIDDHDDAATPPHGGLSRS